MFDDKKVIVVTPESNQDYYDDYEGTVNIKVDTHAEMDTLIPALAEDIFTEGTVDMLLKDDRFKELLISKGWMDQACVERFGNIEGVNRFFVSTDSTAYTYAEEINLLQTHSNHVRQLSQDGMLLQVVNKKCLKAALPELHKKVAAEKRRIAASEKNAKAARAKKVAKKKKRDIAKAKKLLEDAGEMAK